MKAVENPHANANVPVEPPSDIHALPADSAPEGDAFDKKSGALLCFSYFFTTWNVRADEWAVAIFLAYLFPDTLLPVSIYTFAVTLSAICASSRVGRTVDESRRLRTIRSFLIMQKAMIACSALILFTASESSRSKAWTFSALSLVCGTGLILKLSNIGTTIAVEKDWVVIISAGNSHLLLALNAHLRRIDLTCKIAAPLFVSLLAIKLSTPFVMLSVAIVSLLTIPIEWLCISAVYNRVPALAASKHGSGAAAPDLSASTPSNVEIMAIVPSDEPSTGAGAATIQHNPSDARPKQFLQSWSHFARHKVFLSSLAISQLYFTVLSFGTVMVSYLILQGYSPAFLAGMRACAVVAGLVATFALPRMVRKIGLIRAGLWAVWSQAACIVPVAASFWVSDRKGAAVMLFGGTILSRFGLWAFDLAQMQMMQESVDPAESGVINGQQASMQNTFDLLASAATIVWNSPSNFCIPSLLSAGAVISAALTFSWWAYLNRGHLFHIEKLLRWDVKNTFTRRRRHVNNAAF
ncbi:hypothetical protein HDU89_000013 [Geranomyces variabilis]|nr:hypothetical protein HDU89_000013 [Geranomyces variabilis]